MIMTMIVNSSDDDSKFIAIIQTVRMIMMVVMTVMMLIKAVMTVMMMKMIMIGLTW